MNIKQYIKSKHEDLIYNIETQYKDLYSTFGNTELIDVFSALHGGLIHCFRSMNSKLPTRDHTAHYSADDSRYLISTIEMIKELESTLKDSEFAFIVDDYYNDVIDKSREFLVPTDGSDIPPRMEKIKLYFTQPIFKKKDVVIIPCSFSGEQNAKLCYKSQGSYAMVYEFFDSFYNRKFILKRAKKELNEKELERFRQEYEQMSKLHSPYIVEVYNYNSSNNEYIMEYMDGTLSDLILNSDCKPNLDERKAIVYQVLKAFKYIHSKGLLHRDISPSNILIKKYDDVNVIKIADFGLVKVPDSTLTSFDTSVKGTFNDPTLDSEGYANYSIEDETFALTKIVLYIMTGSAMIMPGFDERLKNFFQKGVSSDKSYRYHSVDEILATFKKL